MVTADSCMGRSGRGRWQCNGLVGGWPVANISFFLFCSVRYLKTCLTFHVQNVLEVSTDFLAEKDKVCVFYCFRQLYTMVTRKASVL